MTVSDALMAEAAALLEEARRERDDARQERDEWRRIAEAPTAAELLERCKISGLTGADRLVIMAQNPADCHRWSRAVGELTVGEIRDALGFA